MAGRKKIVPALMSEGEGALGPRDNLSLYKPEEEINKRKAAQYTLASK